MSESRVREAPAAESWLREAFRHIVQELALFGRTFTAFALHARRSAHSWQAGERIFMNPLGFAATAAGMYWGVVSVLAALWPIPGSETSDTLANQLTTAAGPYVHYGLLGIVMHLGLRLLGSERRILGSIGIALFTGGSVGTITALLLMGSARWFGHVRGTNAFELGSGDPVPFILLGAAVTFYALVCLAMARGLMGLHRTAVWKATVAAALAIIVTAFLFGSVIPDGAYGWHPYIRLDLDQGVDFSFGFRG